MKWVTIFWLEISKSLYPIFCWNGAKIRKHFKLYSEMTNHFSFKNNIVEITRWFAATSNSLVFRIFFHSIGEQKQIEQYNWSQRIATRSIVIKRYLSIYQVFINTFHFALWGKKIDIATSRCNLVKKNIIDIYFPFSLSRKVKESRVYMYSCRS